MKQTGRKTTKHFEYHVCCCVVHIVDVCWRNHCNTVMEFLILKFDFLYLSLILQHICLKFWSELSVTVLLSFYCFQLTRHSSPGCVRHIRTARCWSFVWKTLLDSAGTILFVFETLVSLFTSIATIVSCCWLLIEKVPAVTGVYVMCFCSMKSADLDENCRLLLKTMDFEICRFHWKPKRKTNCRGQKFVIYFSGGSRISRRRGALTSWVGLRLLRQLRFENFVCRNKRIWTLRVRAPGTPPRFANVFVIRIP